jgi:DNA topoisomerase II
MIMTICLGYGLSLLLFIIVADQFQMPLWSLTQERVEKLKRQIGDVEVEVDKLIKLSKEDLWKKDLDSFIDEWRVQLDDEHKRKRRINNMGRRTSTKVKVAASGPANRRRKGQGGNDDDDFDDGPKSKKPAPLKVRKIEVPAVKKEGALNNWLTSGNGTQGKHPPRSHDGNSSEMEPEPEKTRGKAVESKKARPAAKAKAVPVPDDSDSDEILTKPVARKARAAASKPIRYGGGESDSDDSNGDDLLGDITNMVKGLPGGDHKPSTDTKSLFSTSRAIPNSSASLKPPPSVATKKYAEISDDDDTNFMALVPQQSPRRSINVTKNALLTDDEDEEEDEIRPLTTNTARSQAIKASKPAPPAKAKVTGKSESETEAGDDEDDMVTTKPKPKPRPAAASKAPKAAAQKPAAAKKDPPPPKKTKAPAKKLPNQLSPAAKAYAAKQAKHIKKTKLLDSEDEEDAIDAMADDLLDSPINAVGVGAKEDDSDGEDELPVKQTSARPARRAAVVKKKPVYVLSDDDDEEVDEDSVGGGFGGGGGGDEESDDDF